MDVEEVYKKMINKEVFPDGFFAEEIYAENVYGKNDSVKVVNREVTDYEFDYGCEYVDIVFKIKDKYFLFSVVESPDLLEEVEQKNGLCYYEVKPKKKTITVWERV